MDYQRRHQRGSTAVRLTFTREESELELVDVRRVRMRVPAGEQVDDNDERIGNWVEVRNDEDEVLYRRRRQPITPETVEVPRVGGGFERVPSRSAQVVSILVPDVEGARRVLLRERRRTREERAEPEEIDHASVSLDEVDEHNTHDGDGEDDRSRTARGR